MKLNSSCYNLDMKKTAVVLISMFVAFCPIAVSATSDAKTISEAKKESITKNCSSIVEKLKELQHEDSKIRLYLGRYYEIIQLRFITPFNVRLSENTLSDDSFVKNQNDFSKGRNNFMIDFIEYQKELERLISADCKNRPAEFYDILVRTRELRKIVESDTKYIQGLMTEHLGLVKKIGEKL